MRRSIAAAGLLALASRASAQVASVCAPGDSNVCFKLNIPANTASTGSGDIFFQISGPSTYEWVALGQGTGMTNANIFVIYVDASGNNVTLSPRHGTGHVMPEYNSAAQVTLLEGTGVSNGKMVANVRCSNCNSWSGGSADFKGSTGNWIFAAHSTGGPKKSNSNSATITQHDNQQAFTWDYSSAKGGNSVNPLVNSAPQGTASGGASPTSCVPRSASSNGASSSSGAASSAAVTSAAVISSASSDDHHGHTFGPDDFHSRGPHQTGSPDKRQSINYCDEPSNSNGNGNGGLTVIAAQGDDRQTKMLIAHGTLAALAFVIFFPAGAIAIRLASFPGIVWLHAAFQALAYLVYIAAFGLGIYIANDLNLLDEYHPIIGIVVFVLLFFQPIFGFLHHAMFKKYESRTLWSYAHLWLGRIVITLGLINGGLGFKLADTMKMGSRSGMIAYAVVAGVVWLAMVAAAILGERKRHTAKAGRPPKYTESPRAGPGEDPALSGHYAPK